MSCGNKERTLSKSNRKRQSLSSERAGDVGVDKGVPAVSEGGATGSSNGGRIGAVCSEDTSTSIKQLFKTQLLPVLFIAGFI